jgi:hypothetical protein
MPALKWHPFAEKFPPIEGSDWEAFKESIRAAGGNDETVKYRMVKGRREYLDGKNRDRACQELHLECKAEEVYVPDDEVKDYILRRNVHRRHMTVETRRAIVAELHADGESGRQIAGVLGVDEKTIRKDLKVEQDQTQKGSQSVSGADLSAPGNPEIAKVLGKDGKTYPATKPPIKCDNCKAKGLNLPDCPACARERDAKKRNLCDRCTKEYPGKGKPGCPACRDLNHKPKAAPKVKPPEDPEDVPFDSYGTPLPKRCRDAYCDPWIQEAIDFLGVTSVAFWQSRLSDGMRTRQKHYPEINGQEFRDGYGQVGNDLDKLLEHLKEFRPAGVCPACGGAGCSHCHMKGLVSRKLYEKLKGAANGA